MIAAHLVIQSNPNWGMGTRYGNYETSGMYTCHHGSGKLENIISYVRSTFINATVLFIYP